MDRTSIGSIGSSRPMHSLEKLFRQKYFIFLVLFSRGVLAQWFAGIVIACCIVHLVLISRSKVDAVFIKINVTVNCVVRLSCYPGSVFNDVSSAKAPLKCALTDEVISRGPNTFGSNTEQGWADKVFSSLRVDNVQYLEVLVLLWLKEIYINKFHQYIFSFKKQFNLFTWLLIFARKDFPGMTLSQ